MKKQQQQEKHKKQMVNEESKKKERHIVTWTQEEDDILREQIGVHGTENWAIIASKFKDKTTRQCRRRWYTYLNSDFKKGGWSPEEDMLLCEAQKIFGNRWTEIAKVVSGRTDNAVKNRFSTLCKKRAKYEALVKENSTSYINSNNKRIFLQHGCDTDVASETAIKKMRRSHIPDAAEKINFGDRSHKQNGIPLNEQSRAPFAVLAQNTHNVNLPDQHHVCNLKFSDYDLFPSCEEQINNDAIVSALSSSAEFSSPLQVTPLFRSLAAGIPSPQFSESERSFLMKTLGMESPSLNPSVNPSQPPLCKRALLI
ncbi:Transcription factor MYB88 [Glycine max]|nr:Transcription factor MYB88 [Glycine max]